MAEPVLHDGEAPQMATEEPISDIYDVAELYNAQDETATTVSIEAADDEFEPVALVRTVSTNSTAKVCFQIIANAAFLCYQPS